MLVLSRKVGQRVVIDGRITLVINQISGNRVAVGIEAPEDVHIIRGELKREWDDASYPPTAYAPSSVPPLTVCTSEDKGDGLVLDQPACSRMKLTAT